MSVKTESFPIGGMHCAACAAAICASPYLISSRKKSRPSERQSRPISLKTDVLPAILPVPHVVAAFKNGRKANGYGAAARERRLCRTIRSGNC